MCFEWLVMCRQLLYLITFLWCMYMYMYTLMLGVMPFPFTSFPHRTFWRQAMWYKWYQNYVAKAFEYWRMGLWIVVESPALPVSSCVRYSKHHSHEVMLKLTTWRQDIPAERNCLLMLKPSNHQSRTVEVGTFYTEMMRQRTHRACTYKHLVKSNGKSSYMPNHQTWVLIQAP